MYNLITNHWTHLIVLQLLKTKVETYSMAKAVRAEAMMLMV